MPLPGRSEPGPSDAPTSQPDRALRLAARRPAAIARGRSRLPALVRRRLLPLAVRSATAVALGLAAEYALRGALNRLLDSALAPLQRSASAVTRTVITEVIVVERVRRRH